MPVAQAQALEQHNDFFTRTHTRPCSLRTTRGRYAAIIQGSIVGPNAAAVASVGTFEQDFAGNITGSDTASFGGQIIPRTYSGKITVNADGTSTARLTVQTGTPGLVINLKGVLVDGGKEIHFIQADPGTIITGVAKRQ